MGMKMVNKQTDNKQLKKRLYGCSLEAVSCSFKNLQLVDFFWIMIIFNSVEL